MKRNGILSALLMSLCLSGLLCETSTGQGATVEDCVVRFGEEVDVPALESGRVVAVMIKLNSNVSKGQELARQDESTALLKRRAAVAGRQAAEEEMQDDIDLQYATALYREASEQLDADRSIYQKGGGSLRALRQSELATERARLEILRAQKQQRLAKIQLEKHSAEVEAIDLELQRLHINSPIDGVILNIDHRPGEWIEAGQSIARVARLDQIRVHAFLSAHRVDPKDATGCRVSVHWTESGILKTLHGVVESIDPEIHPGNRYRLHATIENQFVDGHWVLRPGMHVNMQVHRPTFTKQ